MSEIKLFCFPYAGGSSVVFNKWKQYLDAEIELVPIELAGRGRRMHEALYPDVPAVVDDVYELVCEALDGRPYALFGHSMGAMISYRLCQKLRENNLPEPLHVFFSGRSAPHINRPDEKKYHLFEEEKFKEEVISLGGTPPEFFDHPELLEIFLPVLKNDFKLAETDIHTGEIRPFDNNISVFLGKEEDLTTEQCDGWKKHTKKLCSIHYFEGGHFFLNDEAEQVVKLVNNTLLNDIYV